jgi:hypothetical protein
VVPKVKEKLALSKRTKQKFEIEWFNLKKLKGIEGKEQYDIRTLNRFAALDNLDGDMDIDRS